MTLRPLILTGLFISQFSFANPASTARGANEGTSLKNLNCIVEAAYQGEILPETSLNGSMILKEDGESIRINLFGNDPQFEVLVQYYRSEMEDDGSIHERIEIAIADLKKDIQEDYISSKVKSLMFVTSLSGSYYDNSGAQKTFDTVMVECHPSN